MKIHSPSNESDLITDRVEAPPLDGLSKISEAIGGIVKKKSAAALLVIMSALSSTAAIGCKEDVAATKGVTAKTGNEARPVKQELLDKIKEQQRKKEEERIVLEKEAADLKERLDVFGEDSKIWMELERLEQTKIAV